MPDQLATYKVLQEGHHDVHYPSWGYAHLAMSLDGPRVGRYFHVFNAEKLPIGFTGSAQSKRGLLRFNATQDRVAP